MTFRPSDSRIQIRMDPNEKERYKILAKKLGMSLSTFFRVAALEKIKRELKDEFRYESLSDGND